MKASSFKKSVLIFCAVMLIICMSAVLFGCQDNEGLDEVTTEGGKVSSNQTGTSPTYNNYTVTTEIATPTEGYSDYSEMVNSVVNSVVIVYIKSGEDSEWISNGSGVFYGEATGEDGSKVSLIVTCCHVIDDATAVCVGINTADADSSNDQTVVAEVVGMDDVSDVAVLKIDGGGYNYATLRNTDEAPIVLGEEATAIGNALGAGISTTKGIISGTSRNVSMDGITMTLLQTDASVNGGNSGGALFDSNGYLIGMVNAKSGGTNVEGIGYAIPVYDVISKSDSLISTSGNAEYGGLGYIDGEIRLGATFAMMNSDQVTSNFPGIGSTPGEGEYYYYVNSSPTEISAYGSISKSGKADTMAYSIIKSASANGTNYVFTDDYQIDDFLDSMKVGDKITFYLIIPEEHSVGFFQHYYTYEETTCEITLYQYVYGHI